MLILNLVSMTDESIRKKFIQPYIRFIGFKGMPCLCKMEFLRILWTLCGVYIYAK